MEAASLCPKCGIELQAERGSRCPLCGTALESKVPADPSFATTDPGMSMTATGEGAAVGSSVPQDPESAPTTRGWSIDAPPEAKFRPALPTPSAPFTPMPSLVPSMTSLPPPPFASGANRSPSSEPLPGPPVLARIGAMSPFAEPDDDTTDVSPAIFPRDADDAEEAVPASALEYDRAADPGAPPRGKPSQGPPPPPPWGSAKPGSPSPLPEVPTLSPTRVSRPGGDSGRGEAPPIPLVPPPPAPARVSPPAAVLPAPPPAPSQPTTPAQTATLSSPAPAAQRAPFGTDPTIPMARAVPVPARMFSQSMPVAAPSKPSRVRGVLLFLLAIAGMAAAFAAGRYTAPAGEGGEPFDSLRSLRVKEAAETPATEEPTATPDGAAPSPEPSPEERPPATPEPTRARRARANR